MSSPKEQVPFASRLTKETAMCDPPQTSVELCLLLDTSFSLYSSHTMDILNQMKYS